METKNYWLFIIPENKREGIWSRCKNDNVIDCEYIPEYHNYQLNMNRLQKVQEGDNILVYLNEKTIGGFCTITEELFVVDESNAYPYGSYGYRQRIGVTWDEVDEIGFTYDRKITHLLGLERFHTATIHELSQEGYERALNWWKYGIEDEDLYENDSVINDYIPSDEDTLELHYEHQLSSNIINNLEALEPGLSLYEDESRTGKEYRVLQHYRLIVFRINREKFQDLFTNILTY